MIIPWRAWAMQISLLDIDEEGASFNFDQSEKELAQVLNPILGDYSFNVDFLIKPLGNAFQVTGSFKSEIDELCSLCGWEVHLPVAFKINEILMEKDKFGRTDSTKASASHMNELSQPNVSYYDNHALEVGDFLHELVALAVPAYPKCQDRKKCDSQRTEAEAKLKAEVAELKVSPFDVLKKLKQ